MVNITSLYMFYFLGVTVKVYVADIVNDIIHEPIRVRSYQTQTITEFKRFVSNVSIIEHLFKANLLVH